MKISLDAMGGDFAPGINVLGAKQALADFPHIEKIYLVGRQEELRKCCDENKLRGTRVEIVDAPEVVEMHESGILAVRQKKKSSMSISVDLVKNGDAQAVVSAGNTGAAVAASTIKLRLLNGVERAGITSPLPNDFGVCNLLDAGANPEAKPSHLLCYAIMGAVFAKHVYNVQSPTVGVISNGEEEAKGTAFTKETVALIKEMSAQVSLPFEFLGNIEGRDLFARKVDVAVTDGFTGNVILKAIEGTAKAFTRWLSQEIKPHPIRCLGALLCHGAFKAVKKRGSYEVCGGSPLLGVRGASIIAHGSSNALAIRNALRVAMETIDHGVNPHIEETMEKVFSLQSSLGK